MFDFRVVGKHPLCHYGADLVSLWGMLRLFLGLSILHRNHVPSSTLLCVEPTVYNREGLGAAAIYRVSIIGISSPSTPRNTHRSLGTLAPVASRDYGFGSKNVPSSTSQLVEEMQSVLQGKPSELMQTALERRFYFSWRIPQISAQV